MNINEDAFDLGRKLMQGRTETYVVGGNGELVGLGVKWSRRWYE